MHKQPSVPVLILLSAQIPPHSLVRRSSAEHYKKPSSYEVNGNMQDMRPREIKSFNLPSRSKQLRASTDFAQKLPVYNLTLFMTRTVLVIIQVYQNIHVTELSQT